MTRHVFGNYSRLHAIQQKLKSVPLAQYSLVLPVVIRTPTWALLVLAGLALLQATIPQRSDLLEWWRFLVPMFLKGQGSDQDHDDADRPGRGDGLAQDQDA
jgi:hypothetical protein